MKLRNDGWYKADKGKYFVLTEKGKHKCANYKNKTVGDPIDCFKDEAVYWDVEKGYVEEVDIPGWTTLKGYKVVYYHNGYTMSAGNPQTFPTRKAAEIYKKHYESYPWFNHELFIEETEYEGVPLSESRIYKGKEVIDQEHYFGLDCCEIGDYFTEEMVNEFMDTLPPACMRSDCSQIGEPITARFNANGELLNTYSTFKKIDTDIWEYCGDCFKGENVKRGEKVSYL